MRRMTVHRRPTLKTALWLMLTASILFAGNALVGGVEWKRPAYRFGGHSVPHSFPIAVTTELLFWLVLPTVAGMFHRSNKSAAKTCWIVGLVILGLYIVCARNDSEIFGRSDFGRTMQSFTLSTLFGPMLAVELPAMIAGRDDTLLITAVYAIWLGFIVMAADKITGSLQPKPKPVSEASGVP